MIPRYRPALDLAARFAALSGGDVAAATSMIAHSLGLTDAATVLPVPSARVGLGAFFSELMRRDSRRLVVVSAQICPIVPRLLVHYGYRLVFVDTAPGLPAPDLEETMRGYNAAGGAQNVAAVVIAPMYGLIPFDIDRLAASLDGTSVVLDMAQGILLADVMPSLVRRADALVYSFGVGKGLDTRGGLLALRCEPENLLLRLDRSPLPASFSGLLQILAFRAAVQLGAYRYLLPLLEHALETEKYDIPSGLDESCPVLWRSVFLTWAARLPTIIDEVRLARRRASMIFEQPALARHCRDTAIYADSKANHLRQIIRLADADRRDPLVRALRRHGIDAMPAGEPLPQDYPDSEISLPHRDFPNARRFRSDAIRLPFLGRLDERSFTSLMTTLEACLDQRLS